MTNRLNSGEWEALNAGFQLLQVQWLEQGYYAQRQQFVQLDRAMQKIRDWHNGESGIAQGEGSGGAVQDVSSLSAHRGTRTGLEGNDRRREEGMD
jgi:hypothetical protein